MRAIGAGTRVFEVLDRSPLIPLQTGIELSPDRRGVIEFEHVHFEYPTRKDVRILKDFNLQVKVGETVAIVYVASVHTVALYSPYIQVERVAVESHPSIRYCFATMTPSMEELRLMVKVRFTDSLKYVVTEPDRLVQTSATSHLPPGVG